MGFKQCVRLFLFYFALSFVIFFSLLYSNFANACDLFLPPAAATAFQVCRGIASVKANDDTITILYSESVGTLSPSFVASSFSLQTAWLGQRIDFPRGSAMVSFSSASSFSLLFYLPVVTSYNATLTCHMQTVNGSDSRAFAVGLNLSSFRPSDGYSQLMCRHTDSFPRRWCEFRNLAYFDRHFTFFTPGTFRFPQPFLVPGPRAPPFDKAQDQLKDQPLVISMPFRNAPWRLEQVTDFCYIYGVFHNYYMLWHTVFDFMIPLYHFMRLLNKSGQNPSNRRVYVRSDGVWAFHILMRIFSDRPVTIIDEQNPSIIMHSGTLGCEKLERDVRPTRTYDESIGFRYDFDRETARGMRDDLLRVLGLPCDAVGAGGKPLVLLIDRGRNGRNIQNTDEIGAFMAKTCPHCTVETLRLHELSVDRQILMMSRASVLVGLHGSGLTHAVWMHESVPNHTTHLIEVLPYKYLCRNWYETAAIVGGVTYHRVMNKRPPAGTRVLQGCWNTPRLCATLMCHDPLRDQPTTVEMDTFNETWSKIADELKSTIVTK
jgi:hypothetical protein